MDTQDTRFRRNKRHVLADLGSRNSYLDDLERRLGVGDVRVLPEYLGVGGLGLFERPVFCRFLEEKGGYIENLTNQVDRLDKEGFSLEEDVPAYRFWGVPSRGGRLVVTVRGLLEGCSEWCSQADWLERTQREEPAYGLWSIMDAVEFTDVLCWLLGYDSVVASQQELKRGALDFFKGRLTDGSYPVTSTRVGYNPRAPDEVVHGLGYGVGKEYRQDVVIAGDRADITEQSGDLDGGLQALVGRSSAQTYRIYHAVTGRELRLWRLQRPSNERKKRAVVLGCNVDGGRFVIDADDGVGGRVFGWSSQRKNFSSIGNENTP